MTRDGELSVEIRVEAEVLKKALRQFRDELENAAADAGHEAAQEILGTVGVKRYPAEPSTRHKPPSAYVRGIGYINKDGAVTRGSHRYGTQWNVRFFKKAMKMVLGNRAPYAEYLGGEDQASNINKNIPGQGWQRLIDVADDKVRRITRIYNQWILRALRKVGLY